MKIEFLKLTIYLYNVFVLYCKMMTEFVNVNPNEVGTERRLAGSFWIGNLILFEIGFVIELLQHKI